MGHDGRQIGKARRFHNTRRGVNALLDDLAAAARASRHRAGGTGHYWLAVHDELVRAGHTVQVLNPLQTHAYRQTTIRKLKIDREDAWLIADVVRLLWSSMAYRCGVGS
jgi:transposase